MHITIKLFFKVKDYERFLGTVHFLERIMSHINR